MIRLNSNQELYDYLLRLKQQLNARGAPERCEILARAIGCATSMSTEFLGESKIALQRVIQDGNAALGASEKADLEDVLQQIAAGLNRSQQHAE